MAFLLWTLWGLLQEVNENPAPAYDFASYRDYAMDRFTRCKAIMGREDFGTLLEAIRRGDAHVPSGLNPRGSGPIPSRRP